MDQRKRQMQVASATCLSGRFSFFTKSFERNFCWVSDFFYGFSNGHAFSVEVLMEKKYSVTLKIETVEQAMAWFRWIEQNGCEYDYKMFKVMKDQDTLIGDFWANRHGIYHDYAVFTFSDVEMATLFRLNF